MFRSLGGGLVSTAGDYCAFLAALARDDERLGDPALLRALRSPQISPEVVESAGFFLEPSHSYGFQVAVATRDRQDRRAAGRFGWSGGTGTQAFADPGHDLVAVVFTHRSITSATSHPAFGPFWDAVYRA